MSLPGRAWANMVIYLVSRNSPLQNLKLKCASLVPPRPKVLSLMHKYQREIERASEIERARQVSKELSKVWHSLRRNAARSTRTRSSSPPVHFLRSTALRGCFLKALGSQSTTITLDRSRFKQSKSWNRHKIYQVFVK